jgi:hypothetical protein
MMLDVAMRTQGRGRPAVIRVVLEKAGSTTARKFSYHRRLAVAGAALVVALLGAALGATLSEGLTPAPAQLTQQGAPLGGGAEEIGEGHFGRDVTLSADGATALVGAPNDDGNLGAAWVFTPSTSGPPLMQQGAKLTDGEEPGAPGQGDVARHDGAADGVEESGEGANGEETDGEAGDSAGESAEEAIADGHFGRGVALSGDGNTALLGAPREDGGVGAVWVFTRSGSTWTRQQKLIGGDENGAGWFGRSVAISADGDTALVGGLVDHGDVGAVWVFTRSGSTWSQQGAKLIGGAEESGLGKFGASVALSANGEVALIGAPADAGKVGAAWVFARSNATWSQQGAKLTGSGEVGLGEFGNGVALSEDGEEALVGAPGDAGKLGAAWELTRSGSTWTQLGAKLTGAEEQGSGQFGWSVALSGDGATALIGGDGSDRRAGAAWVFTNSPPETESPSTSTGTSIAATTIPSATTASPKQGAAAAKVAGGRVTLASATVTVRRNGEAQVKLRCISTTVCRGTLKLTRVVRAKGRKRLRMTIALGAAAFSLRPGRTTMVALELSSVGRARLKAAAHGRLGARLTIVVSSPSPRRKQTHAVHLVLQRRAGRSRA